MTVSSPRRWWALSALLLCSLVVDLDTTILNVALPTLADRFSAGAGQLQWILNAYTIVMAALFIPAGLLADRLGRKKILLAALACFGAGSVVGALAGNVAVLIAARGLMGAGAGAIIPLAMSILPTVFARQDLAKAMAFASVAGIIGFPLGPVLGGFLLDHFWWGSVMLVNVPVVAFAIIACSVTLPESGDPDQPRFAPVPTAMAIVGLAAFVYGIIEIPTHGWLGAQVLAPMIAGAGLLVTFTLGQLRTRRPMVDFGLFSDRIFLWATLTSGYVALALAGLLFVLPQYLRLVRDLDATATGLAILPFAAGMLLGGQLGSFMMRRKGFRAAVFVGLMVLAGGFGLGALTSPTDGLGYLMVWSVPAGIGVTAAMVPSMTAILQGLPSASAGVGSGLNQTLQGVGTALGVAALGSLLAAVSGSGQTLGESPDALTRGMATVLLVCAAGGVVTAILAARFLPGGTGPQAKQPESDHELARTS